MRARARVRFYWPLSPPPCPSVNPVCVGQPRAWELGTGTGFFARDLRLSECNMYTEGWAGLSSGTLASLGHPPLVRVRAAVGPASTRSGGRPNRHTLFSRHFFHDLAVSRRVGEVEGLVRADTGTTGVCHPPHHDHPPLAHPGSCKCAPRQRGTRDREWNRPPSRFCLSLPLPPLRFPVPPLHRFRFLPLPRLRTD